VVQKLLFYSASAAVGSGQVNSSDGDISSELTIYFIWVFVLLLRSVEIFDRRALSEEFGLSSAQEPQRVTSLKSRRGSNHAKEITESCSEPFTARADLVHSFGSHPASSVTNARERNCAKRFRLAQIHSLPCSTLFATLNAQEMNPGELREILSQPPAPHRPAHHAQRGTAAGRTSRTAAVRPLKSSRFPTLRYRTVQIQRCVRGKDFESTSRRSLPFYTCCIEKENYKSTTKMNSWTIAAKRKEKRKMT
jgi:hypothetical protein